MVLAVSTLYIVDDRTIIECGVEDGIRICRGNRNSRRKPFPIIKRDFHKAIYGLNPFADIVKTNIQNLHKNMKPK
jgi:hypothetical protein